MTFDTHLWHLFALQGNRPKWPAKVNKRLAALPSSSGKSPICSLLEPEVQRLEGALTGVIQYLNFLQWTAALWYKISLQELGVNMAWMANQLFATSSRLHQLATTEILAAIMNLRSYRREAFLKYLPKSCPPTSKTVLRQASFGSDLLVDEEALSSALDLADKRSESWFHDEMLRALTNR